MACLDENTIVALIEGRLPPERADKVHAHVGDCIPCRRLLAELVKAPPLAAEIGASAVVAQEARNMCSSAMADTMAASPAELDTTYTAPGSEVRASYSDGRAWVGRYRILDKLGEGGMGEVFAAEDTDLHRSVAIKLLHSGTPDAADRLVREARAMAKLRHPNVVTVYEVGKSEQDVFVAMELIEGMTLREWLKGDHDLATRLAMMGQAGLGLAAAHDEGLVHRDFKPDNVMIGADGRAQVLDFGLAKSASASLAPGQALSPAKAVILDLTQSGVLAGTPAYMAPEQFRMAATDERTDQFSFCVALFEAIHGKRPFAGDTLAQIAEAVQAGTIVDVSPVKGRDLPERLQRAIKRGLSVDPNTRFSSMRALLAELDVREPSRRLFVPVLVLSALAVLALVWSFVAKSGSDAPASEPKPVNPNAAILATSVLPAELHIPLVGDPLKVTVHRLSNGLTVYISPNKKRPRVATRLIIQAGSRDNPTDAGGLAHMLEHMMFKGSERVGTSGFQAESVHLDRLQELYAQHAAAGPGERATLLKEIDAESVAASKFAIPQEFFTSASSLGVERINGFSDFDSSSFVADVPSDRFALWAKLEADRWKNPVFRLFHSEIGTIFSEKRIVESVNEWRIEFLYVLMSELFPGHAYARSMIGSYDDILAEPLLALQTFYRDWYVPNNAALILVGDVEPEQAIPILEREFGTWQPRSLPSRLAEMPVTLTKSATRTIHSATERLVLLAWPTVPAGHPDEDALRILTELIEGAGGMAQTQFAGRADRIGVLSQELVEGGFWSLVVLPTANQSLEDATVVAEAIIAELVAGRFEADSLEAIVENYRVGFAQALEENEHRIEQLGRSYLRGKEWSFDASWRQRLGAVKRADVLKVAQKYLTGPRVLLRIEPGDRKAFAAEAPHITPLEFKSGVTSTFVQELLAAETVERPLRFVWPGRDYVYRDTRSGPLVATKNTENELFELTLQWDLGSRALPLVCAALAALEDAGDATHTASERKLRWYARALSVQTYCNADRVQVVVSGTESHFDAGLAEVIGWLDGRGLTEEGWSESTSSYLKEREQSSNANISRALEAFATRANESKYLAGPTSKELRSATVAAARRSLTALLGTRHSTLFYGPREASEIRSEPKVNLKPGASAPPIVFAAREQAQLTLLDVGAGKTVEVFIRVPLGLLSETSLAASQTFASYLGSGIGGRLPAEMREARGLSYSVLATLHEGLVASDEASLLISFSAESKQVADAVALARDILRDESLQVSSFKQAKHAMEERYRADWISPRDLPTAVARWRRRGLDADPRPARFTALEQLTEAEMSKLLRRVAKINPIISIVGDLSHLDRKRLRDLGDVRTVTREQIVVQ